MNSEVLSDVPADDMAAKRIAKRLSKSFDKGIKRAPIKGGRFGIHRTMHHPETYAKAAHILGAAIIVERLIAYMPDLETSYRYPEAIGDTARLAVENVTALNPTHYEKSNPNIPISDVRQVYPPKN